MCHKATHLATGKAFAVKRVPVESHDPEDEIALLFRYGAHPNIVTLHEVFSNEDAIYMVMELCAGGELFDQILQRRTISETEAREVVIKLAQVVEHLHSQSVVHRDLKPSNIMYAAADASAESLRVCDFGFAKQLTAENGMLMTPCYTANFVAPEVLKQQGYDKSCDIWSLGILLYTMLAGRPPFAATAEDSTEQILARIEGQAVTFEGAEWEGVSGSVRELINRMLHRDPAQRIPASKILWHSWVRDPVRPPPGPRRAPHRPWHPPQAIAKAGTASRRSIERLQSPDELEAVKTAVGNTFRAYVTPREQETPAVCVSLAPVGRSTLAARRKSKG